MDTEGQEKPKRGRKSAAQLAADRVALTDTPEFKDAVAKAAAQAVEGILATLKLAREEGGTADSAAASVDNKFAEQLAMSLAQLTDQGTGRKRVAPEIMRKRSEAKDLMENLIIAARARGDVPKYQLRNKVYLDEVLVDPMWLNPATKTVEPTVIEWPGVPNEAMVPANDVAQEIHSAYLESIGSVVAVVAEMPQYMTAGGLVVNGRAPARRQETTGAGHAEGGQGLRIAHKQTQSGEKLINVLGTVAAPARQNASSPATARAG